MFVSVNSVVVLGGGVDFKQETLLNVQTRHKRELAEPLVAFFL